MKPLGISVVALGAAYLLVGLMTGGLDCTGCLMIIVGIAVASSIQRAVLWAMVFSGWYVIVGLATVVAAIVNEPQDIGLGSLALAVVPGAWAAVNLGFLGQFRSRRDAMAESADQPEGSRPIGPRRPFQFSLRSLLIAIAIVAIGCAIGSRGIPPNEVWSSRWSTSTDGNDVLWSVGVIGYKSGRPVAGYLWRTEGKGPLSSPTRVQTTGGPRGCELTVDGRPVKVAEDFQLYVNDAQDNPTRLLIPRATANEVFGRGRLDRIQVQKFWEETVEPARRPLGPASSGRSAASRTAPGVVPTAEKE